eukprot:NODE_31196_length_402_cov_0.821818.p2 GENE.NODE_31196_length_402_cov_0.821818~~NODE_31196_length_402_cov_0.821818.p2  ORF type:complete len:84 (-),score=32.91 NODE_31196_length_402_cov_0.821818:92-343(-)
MLLFFFFFFKQKTEYEILYGFGGSESCIKDREKPPPISCEFISWFGQRKKKKKKKKKKKIGGETRSNKKKKKTKQKKKGIYEV